MEYKASTEGDSIERVDRQGMGAVVKENTAFGLDLYKQLLKTAGNLLFSPYSISVALAMTYAGTRGETERQMARVLHFSSEQLHPLFAAIEAELKSARQSGGTLVRSANSLYPDAKYPFLETFLTLVKKYYGVEITAVDYRNNPEGARHTINEWVAENTEGKITELISKGVITVLTRLVLVNAIYFKGNWTSQFEPSWTKPAPFWVASDRAIQVPMMQQTQTFGYKETEDLQVLELPYVGDGLSMVILLPRQREGLTNLESKFTLENVDRWTSQLRPREVMVSLPRFTIQCPFRLDDTLKAMGMKDAFSSEKANFSGLDGRVNELYIGAVCHQAFIDVNEEGSEAAAATAVVIVTKSLPPPPRIFAADRPFIFLIREQHTRSVLFLGRLVMPEAIA
ncbi:MAG: serpin family protein [Cyanosarcina radialis HA8281-LM2]|jgi:serpin B|nr:serpin family protein [Cyanosarcina radialis HA8281-LM2]